MAIRYYKRMKLYLARHGVTNYNDQHLCNEDPAVDVHLTAAGLRQAQTLADELKNTPLDHIFVSQLKRTQQTAAIVNQYHKLPVQVDARLNDMYCGFEGRPFAEYRAFLDAADNQWTAHLDGSESIEDLKKRVAGFIDELRTKNYEAVLVVTSAWVVMAMLTVAEGLSNEEAWGLEIVQASCREVVI